MSWDASDEDTWERWERERRARRAAEAGAVVVVDGEGRITGETKAPAGSHGGERPAPVPRDREALNPLWGLYDTEED